MVTRPNPTSEGAQTDQLHDFFSLTISNSLGEEHLSGTIESTYQQLSIPWNLDRTARKVDVSANKYRRLNNSDRGEAKLSPNNSPQQQLRHCESSAPRCESPILMRRRRGSEEMDELSDSPLQQIRHRESQTSIGEENSDFLGEPESTHQELPIPRNPQRTTRITDAPISGYRRMKPDNSDREEAELVSSEWNEGNASNFFVPPGSDPSTDSNSSVDSSDDEGDSDSELTLINPEDGRMDKITAAFFRLHQAIS